NIAPYIHQRKKSILLGNSFHTAFNGLIPTFNDGLPDAFGNTIFKKWLDQNNINQSEMNPVERLLYIGKRGVGALEYQQGEDVANVVQQVDINELSQIADLILKGKYDQSAFAHHPDALEKILTIGSSVGGAQAKILAAMDSHGGIYPGDVMYKDPMKYLIIKLEHDPLNPWSQEKNYVEFVYYQMAQECGFPVANFELVRQGNQVHFASERFDRRDGDKVHQQTVCALAGFFGKNHEFGYADIFRIMEFLKLPMIDKENLFKQMVFNVASANRDDHTKNFSFLMSKAGEWRLSPAYDLTYPFDPYQSFYSPHKIMINQKTKEIQREDLLAVANLIRLKGAEEIIDQVITVVETFGQRMKNMPVRQETVNRISEDQMRSMAPLKVTS
ncbi:MAG: type II toxin-antitoxin system HipA family toxin, partial [Flavobacteriales bacterium]|nr:type II toxin-antitoxin system HipA family toxin [Flavobacteriales bacterium]